MTRLLARPQAALLAVLCLCGSAHALDPELTTPYKVQVVLRVAPNRLLTPIFKEHLRRDLQQGLQGALGAMGEVEVIDPDEVKPEKQEALWKEVAAKGLQEGLDRPIRGTSAVKTHFVNVDYVDGQYELEARQYDGLTGLASPAVRRERTPDRQFVARTAALLVDRDFGLVGTVLDGDGQAVRVAIKGGGLKVPLDRWVKKGDVFALVRTDSEGRSARVPWTILQADATPGEDGSCACKLLPPQQRPLNLAGTGFRCLKLGTIKAPVRVRVIEGGRKGPPRAPENVIVYLNRQGFSKNDSDAHVPDNDGYYSTEKEKEGGLYDGLAFVTVTHGGQVRTQVPLPLVDDRTVVLPIRLGAEPPAVLQRLKFWETDLLNEKRTLGEVVRSLNDDIGKSERRTAALEHARKALDGLNERLPKHAQERQELAATPLPAGARPLDLSKGDGRLEDLKKGREDLRKFITDVEAALKDENTTEAQESKLAFAQAQSLEKAGDYGQAIALYEKVLEKTKDAGLKNRLDKLKAAWAPQSDEHRKARAFIFDTWPKLESPATMKERVKQAQDALAVCKRAKDPIGLRKLLAVALSHSTKLTQQQEALSPDMNEQDVAPSKELDEVLDPLGKLIKDATTAVAQTPAP
jgi:hypothetical protein